MDLNQDITNSLQKYRALRKQIPIMELGETISTEVIEPFPPQALTWLKYSKLALAGSIMFALISLSLVVSAVTTRVKEQSILEHGALRTERDIARVQAEMKQLKSSGVDDFIKKNAIFLKVVPILNDSPNWHMTISKKKVVFAYSLTPDKDISDLLTSLDRNMKPEWSRNDDRDQGSNRHVTTYVQ